MISFFVFYISFYRRKLSEWENKEDPQSMAFFKKVMGSKMPKHLYKRHLNIKVHSRDSLRECLVKKD